MITVAAMLPSDWEVRLVNRNTEDLVDGDLEWADMVMTGGMLFQQADSLRITAMAQALGKPVVVGGPDVTFAVLTFTEPADFQILRRSRERHRRIHCRLAARRTLRRIRRAEKFQVDVTKTPIPRFDLLKFDQYLYIGVQFSRGCPFTCEFCDIIELYGRNPRAKTNEQMLRGAHRLYELGYRGHVDFVDDNLIGNKKAVKAFLPHLKTWLERHDYPFEFSTEASLNLADDDVLLPCCKDATSALVFVGIESPDPATLVQMRKKQNTRRNIAESIHQHLRATASFVTAGFIVGFDSEKGSIADPMVELIDDTAIPVAMVGLLYALSGTQLGRRLAQTGRLHEGHDVA